MSDIPSRLPARPSLEQLRKQAKERLKALRTGDPGATLSDAQLALAREHGFDSWPKLVHHIESLQGAERFELFERLANDWASTSGIPTTTPNAWSGSAIASMPSMAGPASPHSPTHGS